MLNTIKNFLKNNLNIRQKKFLISVMSEAGIFKKYPLKYILSLFYNIKKDLRYNEMQLSENNLDINLAKKILKNHQLCYNSRSLSWHYHITSSLSKIDKIYEILEIGTFEGEFCNFLSKVFNKAKIFTVDLPDNDEMFVNTYNRSFVNYNKKHLLKRKKNLERDNIKFMQFNSKNILKYFENKSFDLIWVDGDHKMPQVEKDIINSLKLIKNSGYILIDDIIMDSFNSNYVDNASFKILNKLENEGKIKNSFFLKRITKNNYFQKKYICLSKILN